MSLPKAVSLKVLPSSSTQFILDASSSPALMVSKGRPVAFSYSAAPMSPYSLSLLSMYSKGIS